MPMSPRLLRPRAAGGFDPRAITGLALWLDASDGTTVTLNGANVSEWRDKSGNLRHATQSTASAQPPWNTAPRNGLSTISFNSASSVLGPMTAASGYSCFAVFSYQSSSASFSRFLTLGRTGAADNNTPSYTPMIRQSATADLRSFTANAFVAAVPLPFNTWAVASSVHDGSTIANRVNGGAEATASSSLSGTNFSRYAIGAGRADGATDAFAFVVGDFGEVLVFARALSGLEQQRVRQYLGAKWGVAVA